MMAMTCHGAPTPREASTGRRRFAGDNWMVHSLRLLSLVLFAWALTLAGAAECRKLSEREVDALAGDEVVQKLPPLIAQHCKIGADEPPFLAEARMAHCRTRLEAQTFDEARQAARRKTRCADGKLYDAAEVAAATAAAADGGGRGDAASRGGEL